MNSPLSPAEVRTIAADWVARADAGLTPAEAAEFAAWRAAAPAHEAAVAAAERTHELLARVADSPAAADLMHEADLLLASRSRPAAVQFWRWAPALAAAACLALVAAYWTLRPNAPAAAVTRSAEARTLDLADGSTLRLQPGSVVAVQLGAAERRVELREGTVHFSVAKDAARPFIVATPVVQVRAVGTAFEVRVRPDSVAVDVTEGKVEVTQIGATSETARYLVAGQRFSFQPSGVEPTAPRVAPPALAPTVTPPERLVFEHTPLSEVVSQFSRYSSLQIEIADPALAGRPVGGTFDADQAESFVKLLEAAGDVRVERVSATHIILHRAQ